MDNQFLIKFDSVTGKRLETYPLDDTISEEYKQEMLANGFEIVSQQDWALLIGNIDGKEYVKDVVNGGYIEKPSPVFTLEEIKQDKINEFKKHRDEEEVEPIAYNGHIFDYDEKARERISVALTALKVTNADIYWTTADNQDVLVTATDLENILVAVAARSGALHVKYRQLKAQILAAETQEEVEAIEW